MDVDVAANGSFTADFGGKFDILPGDWVEVWYYDGNGNQVGVELQTLRFEVRYDDDNIYARTSPNAHITIQVAGKATVEGDADNNGEVRTWRPEAGCRNCSAASKRPPFSPIKLPSHGTSGWSR